MWWTLSMYCPEWNAFFKWTLNWLTSIALQSVAFGCIALQSFCWNVTSLSLRILIPISLINKIFHIKFTRWPRALVTGAWSKVIPECSQNWLKNSVSICSTAVVRNNHLGLRLCLPMMTGETIKQYFFLLIYVLCFVRLRGTTGRRTMELGPGAIQEPRVSVYFFLFIALISHWI